MKYIAILVAVLGLAACAQTVADRGNHPPPCDPEVSSRCYVGSDGPTQQ